MKTIYLDGKSLSIEQVAEVARSKDIKVILTEEARVAIGKSRKMVEKALAENRVIYGLTTGFGFLKNVTIPPEQSARLQENLVRSHSVGVGRPYSEEVVRAAILVRVNSLAAGFSGVRVEVLDTLLSFINNNLFPYVPEQGSVGASGDLAPLAHTMLAMMGEGEFWRNGVRVPAIQELNRVNTPPMRLSAKEGLALTNGTAFMTAGLALAIYDTTRLAKTSDIALAMSVETMMGSVVPFNHRVHELRPHPGQIDSAFNVRCLVEGSGIIESHKNCGRVQDSYSLRCAPQVHGACRDAIEYVRQVVIRELNSVTDNPLVFHDEDEVRSAGNFHGEPLAIAADTLAIAVSELANISERRIAKMMDQSTSEGLPVFLVPKEESGVSSGYMMAQYTAAALVSENKVLAHPASVDSIPTSANQEDHVSMGSIAVRKSREVIKNAYNVLAIELLCDAQAADFRAPLTLGKGTAVAYKKIREIVPTLEYDRVLYTEMAKVSNLLKKDDFVSSVEGTVGVLR